MLAVLAASGIAGCGDGTPAAKPPGSAAADTRAVGKLIDQGLSQLTRHDTAAATTTFANVLGLDPKNAVAHYNLGYIAQQAGHDDQAVKEYDAALAASPDFAFALYNKAILLEGSDLEMSVKLYRKAIAAEPKNAAAHMRLGFALVHLGKQSEGGDELARGIQLDPAMKSVPAPTYGG